jgi:hypothetical protein
MRGVGGATPNNSLPAGDKAPKGPQRKVKERFDFWIRDGGHRTTTWNICGSSRLEVANRYFYVGKLWISELFPGGTLQMSTEGFKSTLSMGVLGVTAAVF